jgi:hypothetical protein
MWLIIFVFMRFPIIFNSKSYFKSAGTNMVLCCTLFSSNTLLQPASSLSIDAAFHSVRTITTQASFGSWMPVVLYKFEEFVDMSS